MKFIIGLLMVAIALGAFGLGYWKLNSEEVVEFRMASVQRGDLVVAVSASGTIEPEEIVDVGAQVVGRIESFGDDPNDPSKKIDYGSLVKEGTILAQIDDAKYKATLEHAEADVKRAKAEKTRANARLAQTEADWKRAQALGESLAEAEHDKVQADHAMAKASLEVCDSEIMQAEAVLNMAKVDLSYVTIKSPIDGMVIDRRVNVGQTVVTGLNAPSLFLLARDLDRLQVWASVNEADIGMIRIGQPVKFTVDAYSDRTFSGEVTQIRLNASMTQNVVTYTVIVTCDNPDRVLLPYMTANLKFEVDRRDDVLTVPNRAFRWRPSPDQVVARYRDALAQASEVPAPSPGNLDSPEDDDSPRDGTVWIKAGEGLVRPLSVKVGFTDGLRSELIEADLDAGDEVAIGEVGGEEEIGDFTSTFINLPNSK